PRRPVRFATGLVAAERPAVSAAAVPHARAVPLRTPSPVCRLAAHVLGRTHHDGCAPGVRADEQRLHSDRDTARRARSASYASAVPRLPPAPAHAASRHHAKTAPSDAARRPPLGLGN